MTKTTPLPKCPSGQTAGVIGTKGYCVTVCRHGLTPVLSDGKYRCVASSSGTPATITPSFSTYAADITFGLAGRTGTVYHHLARYQLVPAGPAPVLEFLGVEASDGRTAVFWVSDAEKVTGGADCSPSATRCSFVAVKPGGAFYLDLSSAAPGYPVYRVQYDSVTKISSNGAYEVDAAGQELVDSYKSRVPTLKSLRYSSDTGLMTIDLGTSEPTNAVDVTRSSTGDPTQTPVG